MCKRLLLGSFLLIAVQARAQIPVLDIIKQGIKKVIVAVDLQVQRLQNKTIWLQNAQKTVENALSKLRLTEISDWVGKQRQLYDDYFQELRNIKVSIAYYHRVKEILTTQSAIVKEYKHAWTLFRQDKNFTPEELDYMFRVYSGMLEESLKNMDQLSMVINAFAMQMTDARRLELINHTADQVEQTFLDLREFNNQNKIISLQRAIEQGEIDHLKRIYGYE